MKTKRLVEESHNDNAGFSIWAITRGLGITWYHVEYWTSREQMRESVKEFYDTESLFNWIELFEKRHGLAA